MSLSPTRPPPRRIRGVVGLLLASGFGRRFDAGGRRNKLLAALPDDRTLVVASASALCDALEHVAVVVPARGMLVEAALSDLPVQIIRNARAEDGIGASIAVGVSVLRREHPDASGWLIALGDMPFIRPATIAAVAAALASDDDGPDGPDGPDGVAAPRTLIVAPTDRGRRGHPVGFSRALDDELTTLDGDSGAQSLLDRYALHLVECGDPGILRDIDTLDDLSHAGDGSRTA